MWVTAQEKKTLVLDEKQSGQVQGISRNVLFPAINTLQKFL